MAVPTQLILPPSAARPPPGRRARGILMEPPETTDGRHESLWIDTTPRTDFDPIDGDHQVDTVVVGGGIVGVTTALHLQEAGKSVALLEANRIVEGVTGHTTAKLTAQHGLRYDDLITQHGEETARLYANANQAAIEEVAGRVDAMDQNPEFERLPAYTYVEDEQLQGAVRAEVDAARRVGLPASFVRETDLPYEINCAVRFDDQAQFHPRKYLLGLVEELDDDTVFEQTPVTDVEPGSPGRATTEHGTVEADDVVLATHFPLVDPRLYYTRMRPKRSYVVTARLNESPPRGMYYRPTEPYYSIRPHPSAEGPLVLVGGESHKTGTGGSTAERYRRLLRAVHRDFDVAQMEYRWSTQDFVSLDGIPFVGRADDGLYLATGFGGWGMTNGTVAGMLISDLILGRENPWEKVYDPTRIKPLAGAKEMLGYNTKTAASFVKGWLSTLPEEVDDLAAGEADVFRRRASPVAAYRDEDGTLHATSAVCTHKYCILDWNDGEETWDCPCHGSRFDVDGTVLSGPATEGLQRFK